MLWFNLLYSYLLLLHNTLTVVSVWEKNHCTLKYMYKSTDDWYVYMYIVLVYTCTCIQTVLYKA